MRKRKIVITVLILTIIGVCLFLYYHLTTRDKIPTNNDAGRGSFQPFGDTPQNNFNQTEYEDGENSRANFVIEASDKILRRITNIPVSSYIHITKNKEETSEQSRYIRYIDKGTGNIFDAPIEGGGVERVTNTVIPKIYEARFIDDTKVVVRFIDESENISTYVANLIFPDDKSMGMLDGYFLENNIQSFDISPNNNALFFITNNGAGVYSEIGSDTNKVVYQSSFNEWITSWQSTSNVTLTTKPSFQTLGYAYILNTENQTLNNLISKVKGLTVLISKSNDHLVYSESTNTGITMYKYIPEVGANVLPTTLPEKCVWSTTNPSILYCAVPVEIPRAHYPDAWYQGVISFTDELYKIDTDSGHASMLDGLGAETSVDAINLTLSPNEDYLSFINKKDGTLWLLDLKRE